MAYSDFTFPQVIEDFNLTQATVPDLFAGVAPLAAGEYLKHIFSKDVSLGISAHTELSRAVWVVGPILADFWRRYQAQITLIAGAELKGDPEAGLSGFLDFVIGRAPQTHIVNAPVIVIVEAKRDSITDGFGQCAAGLIGAQRFNLRKNRVVEPLYGCSTTGSQWRFMKLEGKKLTLDLQEYSHADYEKILGILTSIVGPAQELLAA